MFDADRGTAGNRWDVLRIVPGHVSEVVLLSHNFFSITTHWCRVTVPCAGDGCPLCQFLGARGLFYAAAMLGSRPYLVELGSVSASHFEQHAKLLHGGMRPGLVVQLRRKAVKQPVYSEVVGFAKEAQSIPLLKLAAKVMALYKYPCPNPSDTIEQYEARCSAAALIRNERLADSWEKAEVKRF